LPAFFHHATAVLSDQSDLLSVLRAHEAELTSLLRPDAKLAIVIVSDGNASQTLTESIGSPDAVVFRDTMVGRNMQISALYAFTSCPTARAEGAAYRELASLAKGAHGDLCQETVAGGLTRVAADIVSQQACEFPIGCL
jgi:hypothetical protein